MATILPFKGKQSPEGTRPPSLTPSVETNEKQRGTVHAFMLEGTTHVGKGSDIAVEIAGKMYQGIMLQIVARDANKNIRTIVYSIPRLEKDDPLKTGEATFTYIVKSI